MADLIRRGILLLVLAFPCGVFAPSVLEAGYLYVSNNSLNAINRYDSETGVFVDRFISSGEGVENFNSPNGLAIGADGYLYVRANSTTAVSQVRRYNSQTGEFVDVVVHEEESNLGGEIHFGPDGKLYVTSKPDGSFGFSGVVRYDINTGLREEFSSFMPGGGFTFGPDGDLFALGFSNQPGLQNVLRLDGESGAFLGEFVTDPGFPTNHFGDVEFGADGNLYVTVAGGTVEQRGIRRYTGSSGELIDMFTQIEETTLSQLNFGPDGNLYVSIHSGDGKVKRYSGTTGEFIDNFATSGPAFTDSWLVGPTGFVFSDATAVPEPSTFWLLGSGFVGVLALLRRKGG